MSKKDNCLLIKEEVLTQEVWDEIAPLAQKLWDECSEIKKDTCSFHGERGFNIQPDSDKYIHLQDHGLLLTMTIRDELGTLKGFALNILYNSLHHKPVKCANVDAFYIEPECRSSMKRFICEIEKQFKRLEVAVTAWPTSPDGKMFEILKRLGYAPDDVVMEKRICALPPQ